MEFVRLLGPALPYLKPVLPYLKPYLKPLLFCYEIRVKELAKGVYNLRKERNRVVGDIDDDDDDVKHVIKWLEEIGKIISEYRNFCVDGDRPYAVCSNGYLPKPGIRYGLSRIVIDIIQRVNVQLQSTEHENICLWLEDQPSFVDFWYEWFESRLQTMGDIMAALEDSNVGIIGVYGSTGVGKTTLIKEVAAIVEGNMFDVVIMVNVTSRPDIRRIQGQIADKLGMNLEGLSESGRAARLRERLNNPKEKTLIILDNNMGVKLDFRMLGIPFENNDGNQLEFDASSLTKIEDSLISYKGCKILMISHSKQLLLRQMDPKGIQTFCVEALTDKEAETMFKTMAEITGDENSLFETLAAQIAKECKGLPMVIATIAKALKDKNLTDWEKAYQELGSQNSTAMPEFSTKLGYDHLENEELKHTFLICARMGHDGLITDLVRYCTGLGFLELDEDTVRKARDRVHAMVGKLKELSLLSDSFSSDRFTMQDIIRDAALSIASQEMHAFALTKEKLHEWPNVDKLESYTAISLQHCDLTNIMKEFPKRINCSSLRVFHLDNKDPHLRIPDEVFYVMKELRVLILTGIHLSPLPSSIKCLTKLRMLCLERCKLGKTLSIIGELKELRVLSFSGSDIERLPVELRQLAELQIFDISNCFKLEEIPAEVLSSLTSLEELYVGNSPIQWKDEEGQGNQNGNASLSELSQLEKLTALDIQIPKFTHFPNDLFFEELHSYKIVIRDFNAYPVWDFKMLETCEASRYLALQLENGFDICYRQGIKSLFKRVENLLLGQLNDVEDILKGLNIEGFPNLKYLSIVSNSKVKSIINSEDPTYFDQKAFPKLESLFLYKVSNMEHICHSQLTNDSFCKLKIIKLKICGQLKNVFFSSMIKHLSALETIEVSECNSLKEIVTMETQSTGDQIKFPELRSLTLQYLPEFIGFSTKDASTGEPNRKPDGLFDEKVAISKLERMELSSIKIQKIWNDDQSLTRSYFQNLIHLDVNDCGNLRYLLSLSMSKSLMNLQSLFVSECGMMERIFIETEVSMIEIEESIFPNLKNINFKSMKKLRKIWATKFPLHSFGKLDALIIEGCNKLENVFPSYMVRRFQSLCNLKVTNCESMKEIFDLKGCGKRDAEDTRLQSVHVEALPKLEHVWNKDPEGILNFKNLKKIWVQECLNLKHIFPVSIATGLKKLEYLEVWNCGQLKELVFRGETINVSSVSFEFPKLTTARFSKLPNLESFYGGTHELICSTLNNLSVEHCLKLKLFREENANQEIKPVFLPKKVICNLKSMQIEPRDDDANSLKRYKMLKLEECQLSRLVDTETICIFLHRYPNLKSLLLSNCSLEQLVPPRSLVKENLGVVPMLKSLKLMNLPSLKMIGFEEYTVIFRRLECLILKECPCLNTIAPSSVSFTYLTNLEVSNCNKLSCLMTPSTAKSLVRLTTMKVIQCESMKTIVSQQENERIIFKQLKEIELDALRELESFCSSVRCAIEFPSLEKLVVSACGKMKMFTFSAQVNKTPNLRQICVRIGKEEKILDWEVDLNATIKHMYEIREFFAAVDKKCFRDNLELQVVLHGNVGLQNKWLRNLASLKLDRCTLPNAIPSAILPHLNNLKELEVQDSDKVEVIFDMNDTEILETASQLKILTLKRLSDLTRVWEKKSEGVLIFRNLQEVVVSDCENLQTLFPASLAKNLKELEKLEIESCDKLKEIVEKEEGTAVNVTEKCVFSCLKEVFISECADLRYLFMSSATQKLMKLEKITVKECESVKEIVAKEGDATSEAIKFERLNTIVLHSLPSLIYFYSGSETLHLSSLINVHLWQCPNMKFFSQGVIDAKSFRGIQMTLNPDEDLLFHQDLNATVKEMFQSQEALSQSLPPQEVHASCEDILTETLGVLEYPSSVRGIGFGVNLKDCFPPLKRHLQEEDNALKTQVNDMNVRSVWLKSQFSSCQQKDTPNSVQQPDVGICSGNESCIIASNSIVEGISYCKLFVSSPSFLLVAHGKVHNLLGDTLHGRSLPDGYVRVSIDVAVEAEALLPDLNLDDDKMTIAQAIGTFVAWPIHLLKIDDVNGTQKTNESIAPSTKSKEKGKEVLQHPSPTIDDASIDFVAYLRKHLSNPANLLHSSIKMEEAIFGMPQYEEILNVEIIKEVIDHGWLSASAICLYIRYLYYNFVIPNHKAFLFLSPQVTNNHLQSLKSIVDIFVRYRAVDKLVLVPFNTNIHWILLAINVKMEIIYYLDPLDADLAQRAEMKKLFDVVLQSHGAQIGALETKTKSSNIKWIKIKCPKQPNSNDCGYYVCRYMKDIINYYQGTIPEDYFSNCNYKQYSNNQIIEVQQEWSRYVVHIAKSTKSHMESKS